MEKKSKKEIILGVVGLIVAVIVVGVIGVIALRPEPEIIMGKVSATEYRVSGKVPGRIEELLVEEGQSVHQGDTIVIFSSPELEAKMEQAKAARSAAQAQSTKAQNGARQEQISGAYEIWQKAEVGVDIAKKSYDRVQALYDKQVVSAQKRDEAEAQYKAAVATAKAAKTQYDMALNGAQEEDKWAANALVQRASGAIAEVQSYMSEKFMVAPADGEVVEIYPKIGELVGTGAPVASIVDLNDIWFSFSIREDLLKDLKVGKVVEVSIPALGQQKYKAKVTYMRAMASYATWRPTKTDGQYDVKSFDLKLRPLSEIPDVRPGMTVLINDND